MTARAARIAASLLLALTVFGAGCSGNPLERPPLLKQRFVLMPGKPAPVAGARAGVLRVAVVRVSPPFQNRGFVMRTGSDTYANDFFNEFASPPGTLLRELLVEWLRDGSHFASVVRGSEAQADFVLETDLESIYADVQNSANPETTLALAVRLLNAHNEAIVFEKRYAQTGTAAAPNPPALADAWSRSLAEILRELAGDLDAAAARVKPRTR